MQLGKYEILEELGKGGFGTVYKAHDTVLNVERALKVLHPALVADETFLARFKQEAQLAARLEHPNLVPVYDFGEANGRYFLAMKYMPGGSLKDLLTKKGRLTEDQAMEFMKQSCDCLSYIHRKGIIHRDIKPGNLLFDDDGKVRISDLGFAKAMAESNSTSLSVSGAMVGTPAYIAPEIWRGEKATGASDQYSLACVFVEMITGKALFSGDSTPAVMLKHFEPVTLPEIFPEKYRKVVLNALEKMAVDRYGNIDEFGNALLEISGSRQTVNPVQRRIEVSKEQPISVKKLGDAAKRILSWLKYALIGLMGLIILFFIIQGAGTRRKVAEEGMIQTAIAGTQQIVPPTGTVVPTATRTGEPTATQRIEPTRTFTMTPTITKTPTVTPTPLPAGSFLMPDFVDRDVKDALDFCINNNLTFSIKPVLMEPVGTVLSQTPMQPTIINRETKIEIEVSSKLVTTTSGSFNINGVLGDVFMVESNSFTCQVLWQPTRDCWTGSEWAECAYGDPIWTGASGCNAFYSINNQFNLPYFELDAPMGVVLKTGCSAENAFSGGLATLGKKCQYIVDLYQIR